MKVWIEEYGNMIFTIIGLLITISGLLWILHIVTGG